MYIKKIIVLLPLVIFILIQSCTDSTEPEKNSNIRGVVVDSLERPISGVKILPVFYFDPPPCYSFMRVNDDPVHTTSQKQPTTKIIGTSPNPSYTEYVRLEFYIGMITPIDLFITDQNEKLERTIFEDSVFYYGTYHWNWDGKNDSNEYVENGLYTFHLLSDTISCSHKMFLNKQYDNYTPMEEYNCSIVTDQDGKFEINQSRFPLGDSLQYVNEMGEQIGNGQVTRYVKLWALNQEYQTTYVDSVYVDKQEGCFIQIQLDQQKESTVEE